MMNIIHVVFVFLSPVIAEAFEAGAEWFLFLWPVLKDVLMVGLALLLNAHIRMVIRDEVGPLAERYFLRRNEQRELERQHQRQAEAENVRNVQAEVVHEEVHEDVHVPKRAKTKNTTCKRYKCRGKYFEVEESEEEDEADEFQGRHANPRQRKAKHAEERRRAVAAAAKRGEE
ncbi:hypothetical protein CCMA1212_007804 [Trichoderma ghanense]|uniref:Uncharacterized protein n=1 Tax=Trichoderma ghanense TaxID=65468 RepID=A0ABY2GXT7_9HYPO